MGSLDSYLECVHLGLEGKLDLELSLPAVKPGIYAYAPVPRGVNLVPPCWVGPHVHLSRGCSVGPYCVLESGTSVGSGSVVQNSVLMDCTVGQDNELTGAVLCRHAETESDVVLEPQTALGAGARVGRHATLRERVRIWPWRTVDANARLNHSLMPEDGESREKRS
jgi:mannose-1-phosphate guanylyltransferase/phosphomannomutase